MEAQEDTEQPQSPAERLAGQLAQLLVSKPGWMESDSADLTVCKGHGRDPEKRPYLVHCLSGFILRESDNSAFVLQACSRGFT